MFITQPSIYEVIVFFCYVMSHWTNPPVNKYDYTMAWLPASPLKTYCRLSTCATTMRVRFGNFNLQ